MVLLAGAGLTDEELRPHQRARAGLRRAASPHRESGVPRRRDTASDRASSPRQRRLVGASSTDCRERCPRRWNASISSPDSDGATGRFVAEGVVEHAGGRVAAVLPCRLARLLRDDQAADRRRPLVHGRGPRRRRACRHRSTGGWPRCSGRGAPRSVGASSSARPIPCPGSPSSASSATCGAGTAKALNSATTPTSRWPRRRATSATILVRAADAQSRVTDALRAAVRGVDPDLPLARSADDRGADSAISTGRTNCTRW